MVKYLCFILCVAGFWFAKNADAHGRLMKPCQRASLHRCYQDQNFPANTNDMALFCGGKGTQWNVNGGKCGICGDPYNGAKPHEAGGKYATGFITETYRQGQEIDATVELTAAHRGKFFFKICKQTNDYIEVTQECLDKSQLKVVQNGELKDYYAVTETGSAMINIKLKLPDDLTCEHCVFQWWYTTGNNWGRFPGEKGCLGCGPQETFVNCADVKIEPRDETPKPVTKVTTAQPITNQPQTVRPGTCHPSCIAGQYLSCQSVKLPGIIGVNDWCYFMCKDHSPNCPNHCSCTCKPDQQCTIKPVFEFLVGQDFCDYLIMIAPNSYYLKYFCDCI
ncbi:uncharacterized protein LOC130051286 [Ostrea edulis]|uniref:uncharacterized protein LOC130051286 n=1 Tax=Ostrea edulis TaxID=37623 RepID=UPI0024AF1F7C|nr:uncharacterized protein LOC130051286 [Ostrea edulis]